MTKVDAVLPTLPAPVAAPIWVRALIIHGLGLSAAWIGVVGYGLVILIELAF
jgi:hypothetical protein